MYKNLYKSILAFMLTFTMVSINAQTLKVSTKVDYKDAYDNGTLISSLPTKATYDISLEMGDVKLDSIVSAKYTLSKGTSTIETGELPLSSNKATVVKELSDNGQYSFAVTISYNAGKKIETTADRKVAIYKTPSIAQGKKSFEVFVNTSKSVTLTATKDGGFGDGWSYQWKKNGQAIAGANNISYTVDTKTATNGDTYVLEYQNSIGSGDKAKIWAKGSLDYTVKVFNPSISLQYWAGGEGKYKDITSSEYDAYIGDSHKIKVIKSGKNDGWSKASWNDSKSTSDDELSFVVEKTNKYTVTLTNKCADDEKTLTKSINVNAYTKPEKKDHYVNTINIKTHKSSAATDKATKEITASITGGKNDWTITWTDNGNKISETKGRTGTITTEKMSAGHHQIVATLTNNLTPVKYVVKETIEVDIVEATIDKFPTDSKIVTYKNSKTPIEFGVNVKTTDNSSCSYQWYKYENSTKGNSLGHTSNTWSTKDLPTGQYAYLVEATHTLQDHTAFLQRVFTFEIYEEPNVSYNSEQKQTVFDGDIATMKLSEIGGYNNPDDAKNGWKFVWKKNGIVQSNKTNNYCQYTAHNEETSPITDVWTCTVTNTYNGKDWYGPKEFTFNVQVNPKNCVYAETSEWYFYNTENMDDIINSFVKTRQNGENITWKSKWILNPELDKRVLAEGDGIVKLPKTTAVNTGSNITSDIYRIEATCSSNGQVLSTSYVDFKAYIIPNQSISKGSYPSESMDGRKETFTVNTKGGNLWKYDWEEVGVKKLEGSSSCIATINNGANEVIEKQYKVTLKEYRNENDFLNGKPHAEFEPIFYTVKVYPKAKVTDVTFDNYYGQYRNIYAKQYASGGYPNGWTYEWYENGSYFRRSSYYESYMSYDNSSDKYEKKYQVVATNKYSDGTVWAQETFNVTIKAWSKGTASRPVNYLENWDNGNTADLKINHTGGYEYGWHYTWYLDGKKIGSDKDGVSWIVKMNDPYNDMGESHEVTVYYYNELNGTIGCEGNTTYYLTYWPAPILADKLIIQDNGNVIENKKFIRVGNQINMTANPQYGYKGGWEYEWTRNKSIISTDRNYSGTATLSSSKDTKYYEDVTYTATMVNYKANGSQWLRKYYENTFRIYNKPQTPISLAKMGNGTTCTMVVTMPINDEDLRKKEYYLLFGYDDANGVEHYIDIPKEQTGGTGTQRWYNLTSNVFNDSKNKFWVCSVWDYSSDNVQITSGKRYVNSKDEDWDGSSTDLFGKVTRGTMGEETTDINSIATDSGITVVGIYTLGGNKIPTPMKGVNILKMSDGSTRKVVVK